jgi:RES domain-containing protein
MCGINIPDTLKIKTIKEGDLPKNWRTFPHQNNTQKFGDKFILENKYVACKIPSAVVKGDYNILINPRHKDFKLIKIGHIEKFPFDERLSK